MPMLDGLALEHMTQDCSFLKNQLLKLKTLLEVRPTFAQMQTQKPIRLLAYLSSILCPITETFVLLNMNSRLRLLFWVLIIHTDCKHCLYGDEGVLAAVLSINYTFVLVFCRFSFSNLLQYAGGRLYH